MKFASTRLIAHDIQSMVAFYEMVTGLTADWLAPVFAEIVTPSGALAIGAEDTVALWQADEAVVWVTSNGSEQMIREIGEQLPQHAEHHASLLDRVRAGLGRLVPAG